MIEVTSALFVLPCFNTDPKSKSAIFFNAVHFEKLEFKITTRVEKKDPRDGFIPSMN